MEILPGEAMSQTHISEWLTALGTLGAVVAALFLAIFHEHVRRLFWKPRLDLQFRAHEPDLVYCPAYFQVFSTNIVDGKPHRVQWSRKSKCLITRVRVRNNGNASATNVEAIACTLQKWNEKRGQWVDADRFLPLNLRWSSSVGEGARSVLGSLNPGSERSLDVFQLVEPHKERALSELLRSEYGFSSDKQFVEVCVSENQHNTLESHLYPDGKYRLGFYITYKDHLPVHAAVEFTCAADWASDIKAAISACSPSLITL